MTEILKNFLSWLLHTPLINPLVESISESMGVPQNIVLTYATMGFSKYWIKYLLIIVAIIIVIFLIRLFGLLNRGNLGKYNPDKMSKVENSPLKGKNFIFLGSSVTKGFAAYGKSFVDMIAHRNDCACLKEAVSGTTLVEKGNSYVKRLKEIDKNTPCDVFICQLSTNDATKNCPLGEMAEGKDIASFDTKTVCGAIEYVIAYAKETWNCPVVFYTNPCYNDERYAKMVEALEKIAEKWGVEVIDLWHDADMAEKCKAKRYRNDQIHPTKLGYQDWTPIFESALANVLEGKPVPAPAKHAAVAVEPLAAKRKKKKVWKVIRTILIIILCYILIVGASIFSQVNDVLGLTDKYNSDKYLPSNTEVVGTVENSPIEGKTILWLGSSVMDGFGAKNISMVEFVSARNNCNYIKDCYSGTYLATTSELDYLPRLLKHDKTTDPVVDLVVVQLSTNDSRQMTEIGEPTPNDMMDLSKLDQTTTCGALEYILGYAKETWGCPTLVFSSLPWEEPSDDVGVQNPRIYEGIVEKCRTICDKWGSSMLDMWNEEDTIMDGIDAQLYDDYMTDGTHPSRWGYLTWWTPFFEESIYEILG